MRLRDRIYGCLFGTALGDALGSPTEFKKYQDLASSFPTLALPFPARVTDDTQMAMSVGWALKTWWERMLDRSQADRERILDGVLREEFITWLHDPENTRAPGMTCLRSCEGLESQARWSRGKSLRSFQWVMATALDSKGCGANMRVMPVAFLPLSDPDRAGIAQFQAALTHAHPTALVAADITAYAISYLLRGGTPETLLDALFEYAESQKEVYHHEWLGPLWRVQRAASPEAFIKRGWHEMIERLIDVDVGLENMRDGAEVVDDDPCYHAGQGWVAEEAFSSALLCFLLYPEDPMTAIRRGAVSNGDSDSIACIAGALAGAHKGMGGWDSKWVDRIEYKKDLEALAAYFTSIQPEDSAISS